MDLMIDVTTLANALTEFSCSQCIAICAVLVPLTFLPTCLTIALVGLARPAVQVRRSATLAIFAAGLMLLHVGIWFLVNVVMAPTYILLVLAITCSLINGWAIGHPRSLERAIRSVLKGLVWAGSVSRSATNRLHKA